MGKRRRDLCISLFVWLCNSPAISYFVQQIASNLQITIKWTFQWPMGILKDYRGTGKTGGD